MKKLQIGSKMGNKKLTAKQESFARHYVANGFNATQAAISAGYSLDTAQEQSARLLSKVMMKALIADLQSKTVAKSAKGAEDVYNMAANAAFFDVRKVMTIKGGAVTFSVQDFEDLPEDVAILIQSIEEKKSMHGTTVKVTFVDKLKALEMLARFNGMNKDKLEVTSNLTASERAERIAELKAKMEGNGPV